MREHMAESALEAFLADRDAPCPSCGYNLRGLGAGIGATCPECHAEIRLTLEATPRTWVYRAVAGALLLTGGALTLVSVARLWDLFDVFRMASRTARASVALHAWFGAGVMLVAAGIGVYALIAAYLLMRRWRAGVERREALASATFAATMILGVFAGVTLAYGLMLMV